jgi:hypothetical protein
VWANYHSTIRTQARPKELLRQVLEGKETMRRAPTFNQSLRKTIQGDPNVLHCDCGLELIEVPVYCVELKKDQLVKFCVRCKRVKYEQDTLTKSWEPYSPKLLRDQVISRSTEILKAMTK